MKRSLLAALLLAPALALAQAAPARVSALEWMSGTWLQKTEGRETVTESWVGPGNGLMVAVNLTTWPSGKKSYEFLRIADTASGLSYFASPGGAAPVEFALRESGPQRVLYWRDGEFLVARIEGTIKGKERSEEWRFSRMK